ncbi:MAG: DUF1801 domain-containing protein [Pseudomonadota bacterium]
MDEPTETTTETGVEAALDAAPEPHRRVLARAAAMIREEAEAAPEVARLEATLKWGQPSFAPSSASGAKTGTPIRLGLSKDGEPALFVHCGTTLIADWAAVAGPGVRVEGRRALILEPDDLDAARPFVRRALTYRRRKAGR